ncbi:nucleotide-diphospho-sugar transferase, partial [Chytridium lagenaria]
SKAYATLITRDSYTRAVIVLAKSLARAGSAYPLLVLYSGEKISKNSLDMIAKEPNVKLIHSDFLTIRLPDGHASQMVFERFADVWTKLNIWSLIDYDLICYLDADMLVLRNMDDIFTQLPEGKDLAAVPACVCNPHKIKTYPDWWIPENCAHTHAGRARSSSIPSVTYLTATPLQSSPRYFNSGLLLLRPSLTTFNHILDDLANKGDILAEYAFPDQDYLNHLYKDFVPLSYKYNALKTLWKYHQDLWETEEVCNIHYILEKPWD